ncbi:hypothetical protein [Stieleria sedimenti]|uniref:hypothetical protein n=1 Tax=Stieleria sedimenti TaxID=2976331 RepID=UPI00217FA0E8|nr:hypothetical protein [Stieleria sedimenti]
MTLTEFRDQSELPSACYKTEYGLQITSVTINAYPPQVRIEYLHSNLRGTLTLDRPSPLESLAFLFDDCYWIRIYDLNETGASLNFGRYEVHMLDEDSPQSKMVCDRYTAE